LRKRKVFEKEGFPSCGRPHPKGKGQGRKGLVGLSMIVSELITPEVGKKTIRLEN